MQKTPAEKTVRSSLRRGLAILTASSALATTAVPFAMPPQAVAADLQGTLTPESGAQNARGGRGNGGGGGGYVYHGPGLPSGSGGTSNHGGGGGGGGWGHGGKDGGDGGADGSGGDGGEDGNTFPGGKGGSIGEDGQSGKWRETGAGGGGGVGALKIDPASKTVRGGNGGNATSGASGGGGGGGGAGLYIEGNTEASQAGMLIEGGSGGRGGANGGGGGGAGVVIKEGQLSLVKGSSVRGGAGGTGVRAGAGGDGVTIEGEGARFENYGAVTGGDGGKTSERGTSANAGAGIRMGDGAYVVNAGIVSAGTSHGKGTPTQAIEIVGRDTTLELRAGTDIKGGIVVEKSAANSSLVLGGNKNEKFDVSLIGGAGFEQYRKLGKSDWTFVGATDKVMSWNVNDGTLTLTGADNLGDAKGTLTLNGGGLRFKHDMTINHKIDLESEAGSIDTGENTDTIGGVINGNGALTKAGAGMLTLTGANSYTGGTFVKGGTLQIGNGGKDGNIHGDVALSAGTAFNVNLSENRRFEGVISGEGSLSQLGSNTTTLTGVNSYTGKTVVANGELRLTGKGSIEQSAEVQLDAALDVADVTADEVALKGVAGGPKGSVVLGDKTLVLTDAIGGDFAGTIGGRGGLALENGEQILSGDNTYTGDTLVKPAGELQLGNGTSASSLTSNVIAEGVLSGNGSMKDLINRGIVSPGTDAGFGTLSIDGNYSSEGGRLVLHEELGGDDTKGDRLRIAGNTSGATQVSVINRNGPGAPTVEGIRVIEVDGRSDGDFELKGDIVNRQGEQAVVAGAYAYSLHKGGVSAPDDGNWYLRSVDMTAPQPGNANVQNNSGGDDPNGANTGNQTSHEGQDNSSRIQPSPEYQPGVPTYGGGFGAINQMNRHGGFGSFGSRMRNRNGAAGFTPDDSNDNGDGAGNNIDDVFRTRYFWGRVEGGYGAFDPNGNATGATFGSNTWTLQAGLDGQFMDNENGTLFGSVWVDYSRNNIRTWSRFGDGKVSVNGYGLGGGLTWYGNNGFYLDGQGKATWYKSDYESEIAGILASGVGSFGYALSLEGGKRIELDDRWSVTPQAQLIWSSVRSDSFRDVFGADIDAPVSNSLTGRIGIAANYGTSWLDTNGTTTRLELGGLANVYQDLKAGADYVNISGERIATGQIDKTWGELGITANYSWLDDKYSVNGKLSGATSLQNVGDSYSITGNLG
ncbi:autotransporter outer membrane beta-barrel domain-containing protein, partial [Brucella intermedia]|uniref:autotransporter family protein n=1 Tax=Brucella intermedia TaxID=94625 RepID=UPI0004693F9D